jgi:hypothetical protein
MLSAHEYIIEKQVQWAKNRGFTLIGSECDRGLPRYTPVLSLNLFAPLLDSVQESFEHGNGSELACKGDHQAKMQAVHSSSALSVNVFQYWEEKHQVPVIASLCGFCDEGDVFSEKIVFESKNYIKGVRGAPPHLDVVIHNSEGSPFKCFAIESKFTEPYNLYGKAEIKAAHLNAEALWLDIPHLHELAKGLYAGHAMTTYLDSAQLIKHILGLKSSYGKDGFKLLYLWYEVFGKESADHKDEIDAFAEVAMADGVYFSSLSYQELILRIAEEQRGEHFDYVKYLTERYL